VLAAHAYVIEYRVADACAPPDCKIDGSRAFGRAAENAPSGYVAVGTDKDELFAQRGVVLGASKSVSFTLPRLSAGSVLDASFASAEPSGGPFRAVLEVKAGGRVLFTKGIDGTTAAFERHTDPRELGRQERFYSHVREPLPAADAEITVTLRNEGDARLGVGAPVVLRRVDGRKPRQAVLVFFDAVPYPVFASMYDGVDPSTVWIARWAKTGTLFSHAISPGQLTGSFVRRFFRADYYQLEGDPSLAGQGFDETPPERAPGPVARLAEQGFFTEAIASNLYLSPLLSRIGFDVDYNIESTLDLQIHPQVIAERFAREIDIHGEDDALFVVWFANTHAPWRDGRASAAPLRAGGAEGELDMGVLEPIWKNLLDSVDALRKIVESADARPAERVWMIGADHGHTFTQASRARPWRLTREAVEDGHMHCCLATAQEARTYFAILPDRTAAERNSRVVALPVSTLSAWSELERRLGVALGLPKTSAFTLPGDGRETFDDGIFVSVGNSGSLYGRHGDLSYHAYDPAPHLAPAWELGPKVSRLLFGSAEPAGDVLAEELYDVADDPREKNNLAQSRFRELLDMRKRMTDWLAEYADGPEHERYRYHLAFERPVDVVVRAPREFLLQIDAGPVEPASSASRVSAASLAFGDGERPLGVVDLGGDDLGRGIVVRCAASGLPLAKIDADHPRLNLALARTNCPSGAGPEGRRPSAGEALFRSELVSRKSDAALPATAAPELGRALRRWGYVRDK
jgi:hypothetical protein